MLRTSFLRLSTSIKTYGNKKRSVIILCQQALYSTNHSEFKENNIQVNGISYQRDDWTNVTPTVLSKMERKLHLQPRNPIGIIRQLIEGHFSDFKTFNDLSPIVSTRQNFDDLLIPKDHSSRTKSDNYYFNKDTVLRAHTSAHQLEGLASGANKFLISGDVYRRDEIDSSHYPVFHQIEGLAYFDYDRNKPMDTVSAIEADLARANPIPANIEIIDDTVIHPGNPMQDRHTDQVVTPLVAHLKHSINSMICHLFADEPNLKVRWIEAYFPFTSPSYEVEIYYQGEWLEVLGTGIVQQTLLDKGNRHDTVGWAFGMGLERLAMVLFGIPDIRLFWSQDERFIEQFTPGQINKFQPFSKYPPCIKDISFWLPSTEWHDNNFCESIRGVAGDLVENVKLIDDFVHPKTKKRSLCYRIMYRSMDRNVTNEEINEIQDKVRSTVEQEFGVELREKK
ncbi:phenylalanyl-tRNA synthetase [Halteromyces radiatus]|uniref:phenylalanyl-tRNA synthetase n=1 Tax=Halteromyces radiatus TaxID=101107 RepID=UPI00221FC5FA|nr:phenylalanyl-tRNA synthetase [Halteromyces radiatus]KAI8086470.1 phenylalanyl-tRNA synthetase [Halteromyces radiatus]